MKKNIFVTVVGQFTNVGDVMHRKELLSWLQGAGTLHVYVGSAPSSFIEGLQLPLSSKIYKSLSKWLWNLTISPINRTHFVFNPGEITLSKKRLMGEFLLYPFELIVRIKNGQVLRVGIATMSNVKLKYKSVWRFLLGVSSKIYWRTNESCKAFGTGKVIPDLAFAGTGLDIDNSMEVGKRDLLILSMRGDRPMPSSQWYDAIKSFAINQQLKIVVVSQVRMDNERSQAIADEVGAECVTWVDNVGHLEQEALLREYYRKTDVVVSDRLHVLIAAYSEGAVPCVILTKPSDKIIDHFGVIGVNNIAMYTMERKEDMLEFLESQIEGGEETRTKLNAAKSRLESAKQEVLACL